MTTLLLHMANQRRLDRTLMHLELLVGQALKRAKEEQDLAGRGWTDQQHFDHLTRYAGLDQPEEE